MDKRIQWKSALFGMLGSLFGMLLCVSLSWLLAKLDLRLLLIMMLLMPSIIIAGYRWCRGWKDLTFARAVTGASTLLGSFLSTMAALPWLWEKDLTLFCVLCMAMALAAAFAYSRRRGKLRIYTAEPHMLPRYEAETNAGGLLYNACPREISFVEVPYAFTVGERLKVSGVTLHVVPVALQSSKDFYVSDIAGVFLGGCTGSNVLYDRDFHVLAKFSWSMRESMTFARYLIDHGVPFDNMPPEMAIEPWLGEEAAAQSPELE